MRKSFRFFLFAPVFLFCFAISSNAQLSIRTIDVAGDSISKGFNARSAAPCTNADEEQSNWLTSNTDGKTNCAIGSEGVFSVRERLECQFNMPISAANPNSARSGAQMLTDFFTQASSIKTYLNTQESPRLAAVFLGHNDSCAGTNTKTNTSCSSTDLDPNNYCRTKNESFEREFRKGLDILMSVSDTRIGVVSPVRVSQLCNFGSKANCQLFGNCSFLWGLANICGSLTSNCSETRIIDNYTTMKAFREILMRVTAEYAAIPAGGTSPVIIIGGEMVGGGIKAAGTTFIYSDAPWFYRFNSSELSCCDCFHPSTAGQNKLAEFMTEGLTCTTLTPCCRDTGNSLVDGKCMRTQAKRIHYKGLF